MLTSMTLIDLFMFNKQYACTLTYKLRWLVYETQINTKLLFCIKVNKQMVKLGKYFVDYNFRGSRLIGKYRENWKMQKLSIAWYI